MDLSNLNEQQLEAVKSIGQPNLIFAGAGSGKTRVTSQNRQAVVKAQATEHAREPSPI